MKKIVTFLMFIALTLSWSVTYADAKSACILSPSQIDSFLADVEEKIPALEKEAEILVKLLSSDKHLAKMKEEMQALSTPGSRTRMKVKDTYLARAFKSVGLSLDQLSQDDGSDGNTYQVTCPAFISQVLRGGCPIRGSGSIDRYLIDSTPQQLEKIAEIMNGIIDNLTPVYMLINEKIHEDDVGPKMKFCSRGYRDRDASTVYSIFNRGSNEYFADFNFIDQNPSAAKNFFIDNNIPDTFLDMMKNYVQFQKLSRRYKRPPNGWNYYSSEIDNILAEKAEGSDMFEDLTGDAPADSNNEGSATDSGYLNFDDLKLPE